MKKIFSIIAILMVAALSLVASVNLRTQYSELFEANVEALTDPETEKEDGALWSNPAGTIYCCGSGNVRDCSKSGVPKC